MADPYQYLYRLLRDDEEPMKDGIMGKCPTRCKDPAYHIRQCSSPHKLCQWISTCAIGEGLDKIIKLKKKKVHEEEDIHVDDVTVRYVIIDGAELENYAVNCRRSILLNDDLVEVVDHSIVRIVPHREKTRKILDFTQEDVVEEYLPPRPEGNIARNYAAKFAEVLVERFIPPHCCKEVVKIPMLNEDKFVSDFQEMSLRSANNRINDKDFLLKSEFDDQYQRHFNSQQQRPFYQTNYFDDQYQRHFNSQQQGPFYQTSYNPLRQLNYR